MEEVNVVVELQTVWGWQPALYLFLGGVGAGTFFVVGLVHLITKAHGKAVAIAMWSAVAFLAVGLGLLVLELSAPLRALMMWQSFSNVGSSWMAIGAWLLFVAIVCFVAAALANTEIVFRYVKVAEGVRDKLGRAFTVAGVILGLCVAVYTGILLMDAPGVPFWNTALLPVLFTVSALDTGVAFTAIVFAVAEPREHGVPRVLEIGTICLIVAEALVLALFLKTMLAGGDPLFETMEPGYAATAAASANCWLSGDLAGMFWVLLVAVGLAFPLASAIIQVFWWPRHTRIAALSAAVCVLAGGCTLRFITLLAGAHVDVLVNAVAMIA